MDFSYLIELAKANEEKSKSDKAIKFSTKVSNAKKLKKAGPRADAVNEFLSKIEEEKRKKDEEYVRKKAGLLELRANDNHSKKRIRSMLTRTKGASKAVLEDAKDITTAKGEEQCDEDDYGYESTMSQQIFSKLQNTYSELPEDDRLKFNKTTKSSIEDIKQRVMSSLKKKQEEELGIRKRKRKRKGKEEEDDGFINDGDVYKKYEGKSDSEKEDGDKKEHKRKTLKKIKSEKVLDSIKISNQKKDKYSQFKYDKDKRKEKDREKQRERDIEEEKVKDNEKVKEKKKIRSNKSGPPPLSFMELMKVAQKKQAEPAPIIDPIKELERRKEKVKEEDRPLTAKEKEEYEEQKLSQLRKMGKVPTSKAGKENSKINGENSSRDPNVDKKLTKDKEKSTANKPPQTILEKCFATTSSNASKPKLNDSKCLPPPKPTSKPPSNPPPKPTSLSSSKTSLKPTSNSSSKPSLKQNPKSGHVEKQSMKPPPNKPPTKSREFPAPYFPTKSSSASSHKRIIDSDEDSEYDSEMDDFIDDGDVEMDYSSEIAKMFKYDKSKYRNIDEDVDDMEASYSQMEKEEKFSAKVGLLEDLEDIKREEEEKKRKKKMKRK